MEATLLWMLRGFYGDAEIFSPLLLYRFFYNLTPFVFTGAILLYNTFKPYGTKYL